MTHRFWRAGLAAVAAVAALAFALALVPSPGAAAVPQSIPSPVAPDNTEVISKAIGYLASQQAADGGFGDMFATIRVVLGATAVGYPATEFETITGTTPVDYMASEAITYTHNLTSELNPGAAGALLVAVVAADGEPTAFGGMNIVKELKDSYVGATGAYSSTGYTASPLNQWWAIIGLAAAQETIPITATNYLSDLQRADGGWAWGAAATSSDPDSTAFALQALLASGNVVPWDKVVQDGLQYLADLQDVGGGWEVWGAISTDTTAAVIQAFAAAGYTPVTYLLRTPAGNTPHDALRALQQPDGSFAGYSAAISTGDALMGLAEAPLPILGTAARADLALTWLQSQMLADGSWGDAGGTVDAVLAYASAGYSPTTVYASGTTTSPLDYLATQAVTYTSSGPAAAGKLLAAVAASGEDVTNFGGIDLVTAVTDTYSPTVQAFGVPTNTWHQALALLGLAQAGETIPAGITSTLAGLQQSDGGWKFDLTPAVWNTTTPDNAGLAMQALLAAGLQPTNPTIVSGTAYLEAQQTADGGWAGWTGDLSANSTAVAIQGLVAAGENLWSDRWCTSTACPLPALKSLQKQDGPFQQGLADDVYATRQAVPAMLQQPIPIAATNLKVWTPVNAGVDPDKLFVGGAPDLTWGNSIHVTLPFGGDLNRNAVPVIDYRAQGAADWVTGTAVLRGNGVFTATLPVTLPVAYEVSVTIADDDGVVYSTEHVTEKVIATSLQPYRVYLPLISK